MIQLVVLICFSTPLLGTAATAVPTVQGMCSEAIDLAAQGQKLWQQLEDSVVPAIEYIDYLRVKQGCEDKIHIDGLLKIIAAYAAHDPQWIPTIPVILENVFTQKVQT